MRIKDRKGQVKAIATIAKELLVIKWHMLTRTNSKSEPAKIQNEIKEIRKTPITTVIAAPLSNPYGDSCI